mgnify:CR=1 FL=1
MLEEILLEFRDVTKDVVTEEGIDLFMTSFYENN